MLLRAGSRTMVRVRQLARRGSLPIAGGGAIPRAQSQRVALYEQRFGKFDSGKNAYWSLVKGRPVALAEGARFDTERRRGVPTGGAPRMRQRLGYPPPPGMRKHLMPPIAPQERLTTMPSEAKRFAALPASPPPGPAVAPKEPMFDAIMRQLQEKKAGAAITQRPAFATPGRVFAPAVLTSRAAAAPAGFDMKKLILPAVLIAGAFAVSKML